GGDGLAVAAVLHVAAREHARHSREDVLLRDQVAIRIGFELAFEYLGIRDVADPKKHCARREIPAFAALQVAQTQGGDFLLADIENIVHHSIGEKLYLRISTGAIEHDFRSAKLLTTMNKCHLGREARQKYGFFHGGVAAADHRDFLAREKEAIASRAGRNTVAYQRMLVRQAEPARGRSAGDDQRAGLNDLFSEAQLERPFAQMPAQIGFDHVAHAIFGAEARG